jgi:uncharacterized protein YdeI (YjbR/CyaY-like superfamily)
MSPTQAPPRRPISVKRSPKTSARPTSPAKSAPKRASKPRATPGQVDSYIAQAEPFARPILEHLRTLFHKARPGIGEALKWGHPVFEHEGIVAWLAAFKRHVRFRFWKGRMLSDPKGLLRDANGNVGLLIVTDLSQLPSDKVLLDYIRQAVELNAGGVKVPRAAGTGKAKAVPLPVPDDLSAALRKNKRAQQSFDAMSTTQRNEYSEWLVGAKQDATRKKRLVTAIEWIAEGKPRHWKYIKKAP